MLKIWTAAVMTIIFFAATSSQADELDRKFADMDRRMGEAFSSVDSRWEELDRAYQARWDQLKREVEKKWDSFVSPTKYRWVEYDKTLDARASVDYENREIVLEALQPVGDTVSADALNLIKGKLTELVKPDEAGQPGPAQGQLALSDGRQLRENDIGSYVDKDLGGSIKVEPGSIKGADGVSRKKVSVTLKLAPGDLFVRAAVYKETVLREARRHNIEPELLFAIIQTESYFNYRAVSPAKAYGLMQLIPSCGALDACLYLEGTRRIVTADYLFDPVNNIRLGTAYLFILKDKHFKEFLEPGVNEILTVAAYNWGPTVVRKKVVPRLYQTGITQSSAEAEIDRVAPEETRMYVRRVLERKSLYTEFVRK